jgi:hypothetical protein
MGEYLTKSIILPVSNLEAVIQEANGDDETLCYSQHKTRARSLMDFWARCTLRLGDVEKPGVAGLMKLQEPDYIRLGMHIYCLATNKTTMTLKGACGRCGKPNGATIELAPWLEAELPSDIVGPDPTWEMITPRWGHRVVFGYGTAEREFAEMEREGIDLNRQDLIHIRSVDGEEKVRLRDVTMWPEADHIALREEIKAKKEWYETRIGLKHSCGYWEEINFMLDPRFTMVGVIV